MKKQAPAKASSNHEIRIWIDTYEDIFSDFDPRHYSERNISDDFLEELKKVAREHNYKVNILRLLVPEKIRQPENEMIIMKRLHDYFMDNYNRYRLRRRSYRKKSAAYLAIGMLLILAAGYFSFLKIKYPIMHIPFVILEPGGWFLTWTGFEHIIRSTEKAMPELIFYTKLSRSKIAFENI